MSLIVIVGHPLSTYVRTARMACIEKGISHIVDLSGLSGPEDLDGPANLARHPFGRIPSMRHDSFSLFETSAICRYVDEAFDGPPLQPDEDRDRARMEQWISAFNAYFYLDVVRPMVAAQFLPGPGRERGGTASAIGDETAALRCLTAFNEALKGPGPLLFGDEPTLADLFYYPMVAALDDVPAGRRLLGRFARIKRFLAAMGERESALETRYPRSRAAERAA